MEKLQKMSEAEKQIMDIIWSCARPVTTAEILTRLPEDKAWKQNTVITFLARLMEKGMVKATRAGRANHYEACLTEQEYLNLETKRFSSGFRVRLDQHAVRQRRSDEGRY
ncbi:putative transcriptional regulator [Thermobacillus composti KWC4]|uniref:Putative transcriptional regulator n=1 Tax=Thermobacillus composti (strain DSM 18247 / JCM 13945 / KWC4) TaxID=717605 RepID=L0EH06_THECK|nr:BlaI/MecI/CopY family transcriptional regulator [Thermobacillus composti]AGA58914.1 putative transcriptional regulator [Thermobacillus composti KWC4]